MKKKYPSDSYEKQRDYKLRFRFGLTAAQVDAQVAKQGGICPCCSREIRLVVDHCHDCGAWRGMICSACNRSLGFLDRRTIKVHYNSKLVSYMESHKCHG